MQQQPSSMPAVSPSNITTDQIEKYLEENKMLIRAILDNQNLGKLAECAQYQAQLQKNLMYLAAIADAQPQMSMMPAQMSAPQSGLQQGSYYLHPDPSATGQRNPGGLFSPKTRMQFGSPHQEQQQQQYQNIHGGGPGGMPSEAPGQNQQDGGANPSS